MEMENITFMCSFCQKCFDDESQLYLHTKSAHARILKKVVVTKRKPTRAPGPISAAAEKSLDKIKETTTTTSSLGPVDPQDKQETESAIKEYLKVTPTKQEVAPTPATKNEDKVEIIKEKVEDKSPELDIDKIPANSKVVTKEGPHELEIKIVENPSRRKQRIEIRRITEEVVPKKRRKVNPSPSSSKAAKVKALWEERKLKLQRSKAKDSTRKRFIYAERPPNEDIPVQSITEDGQLPCDPMSIFDEFDIPELNQDDEKPELETTQPPVVKVKRGPGRPWKHGRNALLYAAGLPIPPSTPAVDLQTPKGVDKMN